MRNVGGTTGAASSRRVSGWRLGLSLILLCLSAPLLAADQIKIITHPDEAGVAIDRDMLRAIYLVRMQTWPDGRPIRVFVLPDDNPLHERFAREKLSTYPYVLRNAWDRIVFTGTGLAPVVVKSEQEMQEKVKETPGAIGYVREPPDSGALKVLLGSADHNEVSR